MRWRQNSCILFSQQWFLYLLQRPGWFETSCLCLCRTILFMMWHSTQYLAAHAIAVWWIWEELLFTGCAACLQKFQETIWLLWPQSSHFNSLQTSDNRIVFMQHIWFYRVFYYFLLVIDFKNIISLNFCPLNEWLAVPPFSQQLLEPPEPHLK